MRMKTSRFGAFYLSLFFVILYLPVLGVILYSFNASPQRRNGQDLRWIGTGCCLKIGLSLHPFASAWKWP